MIVVLAPTLRECELVAYERGIPPKGRDTLLVPTDNGTAPNRCRGVAPLSRDDVIEGGSRGRHHDEVMRTLEPAFYD